MKRWILALAVFMAFCSPALAADFADSDGFATNYAGADARYLNESSNLSDLDSAATARTNLGLDAAALEPLSTFYQVANNFTECTPTTALTNLGFSAFLKTLIGAADAAAFYTGVVQDGSEADSGALKLASAAEAIAGTNSTKAVTPAGGSGAYLDEAANGSDIANAATFRGNIGLGDCATAGFATYTDINTGTEAAEAIAPDALADSIYAVKIFMLHGGTSTALTGEDSLFCAPFTYAGTWELVSLTGVAVPEASLYTASSDGVVSLQVRREVDGESDQDMFSTALSIDANERTSTTAVTAAAIGDHYTLTDACWVCVDAVTIGVGAAGAVVTLPVRKQ